MINADAESASQHAGEKLRSDLVWRKDVRRFRKAWELHPSEGLSRTRWNGSSVSKKPQPCGIVSESHYPSSMEDRASFCVAAAPTKLEDRQLGLCSRKPQDHIPLLAHRQVPERDGRQIRSGKEEHRAVDPELRGIPDLVCDAQAAAPEAHRRQS